MYYAVRV